MKSTTIDSIRYSLWVDTVEDHHRVWFSDTFEDIEDYGRTYFRLNKSNIGIDDLYTCVERWNGYDQWERVKGTVQKLTK